MDTSTVHINLDIHDIMAGSKSVGPPACRKPKSVSFQEQKQKQQQHHYHQPNERATTTSDYERVAARTVSVPLTTTAATDVRVSSLFELYITIEVRRSDASARTSKVAENHAETFRMNQTYSDDTSTTAMESSISNDSLLTASTWEHLNNSDLPSVIVHRNNNSNMISPRLDSDSVGVCRPIPESKTFTSSCDDLHTVERRDEDAQGEQESLVNCKTWHRENRYRKNFLALQQHKPKLTLEDDDDTEESDEDTVTPGHFDARFKPDQVWDLEEEEEEEEVEEDATISPLLPAEESDNDLLEELAMQHANSSYGTSKFFMVDMGLPWKGTIPREVQGLEEKSHLSQLAGVAWERYFQDEDEDDEDDMTLLANASKNHHACNREERDGGVKPVPKMALQDDSWGKQESLVSKAQAISCLNELAFLL